MGVSFKDLEKFGITEEDGLAHYVALDETESLEQYGVKGMKWGVRRTEAQLKAARGGGGGGGADDDEDEDEEEQWEDLTDEQKEAYAKAVSKSDKKISIKAFLISEGLGEPEKLSDIAKKGEKKSTDIRDRPKKKTRSDIADEAPSGIKKALEGPKKVPMSELTKDVPSGIQKALDSANVQRVPMSDLTKSAPSSVTDAIRKNAQKRDPKAKVTVKDGKVTSTRDIGTEAVDAVKEMSGDAKSWVEKRLKKLKHSGLDPIEEEELDQVLEHYGIPGMKWGVRRTPEQISAARKKRGGTKGSEAKQTRSSVANEAKSLSDEELKTSVSRMQMEKTYTELKAGPTPKKGKSITDRILDQSKDKLAKSVVDAGARAVGAAIQAQSKKK